MKAIDYDVTLWPFNKYSLPKSFVSVAVKIVEKIPTHAAILIRHNTINYLHHFPGGAPPALEVNFNEDGWYIYKILTSFQIDDENEIGAFLQYCKRVCSKSKITYSYTADRSYYTESGEFRSGSGLPELGTCVGFCINTLNNTLIDANTSLLQLDDWDDSGIDVESFDSWSRNKVGRRYPEIDWTLYNAFRKRITPLEYLCSSFFAKYPISKVQIDRLKLQVMEVIQKMF